MGGLGAGRTHNVCGCPLCVPDGAHEVPRDTKMCREEMCRQTSARGHLLRIYAGNINEGTSDHTLFFATHHGYTHHIYVSLATCIYDIHTST